MAYIRVDHSKFSGAANEVDAYIKQLKTKMNRADDEVNNMSHFWSGSDYLQFKHQWDRVTNGESTYLEMVNALESYSKYLRYAAEKYKDAQTKAVNRADRLPR